MAMCLILYAQQLLAEVSFDTPENIDADLEGAKGKLQANSGTYFKNLKRLVTNRDEIFMMISVP